MKISQNSASRSKNRSSSIKRIITCAMLTALLVSLSVFIRAQSTTSQLTITVSSQGMTPTNATVGTGIIHLLVKNNSNVEPLHLKVTRESGELVREMTAPNNSNEWAIELDLSAGLYTISEASNTSWNCHVTVQAPPPSGASGPGAAEHP